MLQINYPRCVAYEVDFIGIPEDDSTKDADAICFRWLDNYGNYKTAVYDAGFKAHGKAMVEHINKFYFDDEYGRLDRNEKKIDYVFVSHPHNDHAGGIPEILNNFSVGCIFMNRPWLYSTELIKKYSADGRATQNSLEQELRIDFPYVNKIEKLADTYGIIIKEAFAGSRIEGGLLSVLSPDKAFYLKKVVASKKTKRIQANTEAYALNEAQKTMFSHSYESWDVETLGDVHAETDAENEISIVLYGFKDMGGMLLVGDAGVEALEKADIEACFHNNIVISDDVEFTEIPHHGGRHNVSTSLLNQLFGTPIGEGTVPRKTAYVSVAASSDHPRQVVVNAFIRRGFSVYKTKGFTRWHHVGNMPAREGYSSSTDRLSFSSVVEKW